jgi:hypothetical protein
MFVNGKTAMDGRAPELSSASPRPVFDRGEDSSDSSVTVASAQTAWIIFCNDLAGALDEIEENLETLGAQVQLAGRPLQAKSLEIEDEG